MRKRSRLDAYHDVLTAIRSGVRSPSRIALRVNISWTALRKIVKELFEQGFIEVEERKYAKVYNITTKGVSALQYYHQATKRLTASGLTPDA
jgi:predicted transcriptional regulator